MFRKLILLLVSTVGCFSAAIYAVGLGEYQLNSGLNQPLKAEIKLLSAGDLGDHEIHASMAGSAVFQRVGVERPQFLNNIRFETVRENGEVIIKLSSREPIKEPFLNFLVELNSPKERVIREYTFLLDPPIFDESASSTIKKSQAAPTKSQAPKPRQSSRRQTSRAPEQASFTGSSYGPVSASDTLWSIATQVRPDGASIHQTLVAIYRANPDAFANGNINNLLRGKVLQIPDAGDVSQVPHRAALQDVVMQNRQWQSGGARNIVGNNRNQSSQKSADGDARLTLATPSKNTGDAQGTGTGASQRLQQTQSQLAHAQETSATLQAENDELRARLADALDKIESGQSGAAVDVESTELAILTQPKDEEATDSIENTDTAETDTAEITLADKASDETTSTDEGLVDESLTDDSQQAESSTSETVKDKATPAPINTLYAPTQPKKGFFEELLDSGALLWGGLVAIILAVMAVFWRMRKRMADEEFQDDMVLKAGAGGDDSTDSFALPDVGDDMLVELDMDEEGDKANGSDDENFDPLGEADIYIAYGKYEQAENLLLEAIDENPIRSDYKVKLMECYAENDDKEKFESLAEEVSQAVDAQEWQPQISNMREGAWSINSDSDDSEFDLPSSEDIFGEDDFDTEKDSDADVNLNSSDEVISESDNDFSASLEQDDDFGLQDTEDNDNDEFDIDMDLGLEDETDSIPPSGAVTETFDSLDDDMLSLDGEESLDLELDEESVSADLDSDIELDDSDDISLDLDDEEFSFDEDDDSFDSEAGENGGDEIATKLDLARAYIDMDDHEGAKEILSEVIAEGTEEQRSEAQSLLQKAD